MKCYDIVLSSSERFSKFHSEAWSRGYIYGLLDWRVISQETFDKLLLSLEEYYHSIPARSYNNKGDLNNG